MNLIQVVPGLFPQTDGIGDYALQLARRLREDHGVVTSFLVCDPNWSGGTVEGFAAGKVADRSPEAFLEALTQCRQAAGSGPDGAAEILVQFSPYGYEKRGCPFGFVNALEQWERLHPGSLNVVFHELDVNRGWRPWSSTFWAPPLQRSLIGRVARLARFKYTNTELHRGRLEEWGTGRVALIPNFSTLGEPRKNPSFAQRNMDMVVFARDTHRRLTYRNGSEVLGRVCRLLGVERIVDIGEPIAGDTTAQLAGVPIVRCGRLPVEEVNRWMAASVASFLYYPAPLLTKSSVHAVSCAHGAIPFVFDDQAKERSCPGLITGVDFIPVGRGTSQLSLPPLEELSESVHANYQARASWAAAARVASGVFESRESLVRMREPVRT